MEHVENLYDDESHWEAREVDSMTFDELFNSIPDDGFLEREEGELLLRAAKSTEGTILEVGCFKGRSTVLLASLGRTVITVDPFKNFNTTDMSGVEGEKIFHAELAKRDITNVVLYKMKIEEWNLEPVSFAYLDGDHTYQGTMNQIKVAFEAGAKSVCLHDYDDKLGGLEIKKAVIESELEILERVNEMVWCIKWEGTGAQYIDTVKLPKGKIYRKDRKK